MDKNMTHEDKKRRDEIDSLIYLKQYERRIPIYYVLFTKEALIFLSFMGYQIYYDTMMPIMSYGLSVAGVVFIYRSMVKDRYYEVEKLYGLSKLISVFDFLVSKGKEKDRRYIDHNKVKKAEEKQYNLKNKKESKKRKKQQKNKS